MVLINEQINMKSKQKGSKDSFLVWGCSVEMVCFEIVGIVIWGKNNKFFVFQVVFDVYVRFVCDFIRRLKMWVQWLVWVNLVRVRYLGLISVFVIYLVYVIVYMMFS